MSIYKDLFNSIPALKDQGIDISALRVQDGMFGVTDIKSSLGLNIASVHESFGGIQRITDNHGAVIGQIRDNGLLGQTITNNLGQSLAHTNESLFGGLSMSTNLGSPIANFNQTGSHFNTITDSTGGVLGTTNEALNSMNMSIDIPNFGTSAFDNFDVLTDASDLLDLI